MRIEFSGASDDLFEIDGDVRDEWGCYQSDGDQLIHATAKVATLGGSRGVLVRAVYDGTWSFAVSKLDDGRSLPPWTFGLGDKHEYSTALTIDTGDDMVTVERVGVEE